MTELSQVRWFLEHRFEQLRLQRASEQEQPGHDPIAPSLTVKLIDLIYVALAYWKIAEQNGTPMPNVPIGGKFALQLGAGVYLIIETFAGGEIPTCGFGETSYN